MVVLKNKAISKMSPFALFVHFLPSNSELDWRMEGKREKRGEDNHSSIPIPLTSKLTLY